MGLYKKSKIVLGERQTIATHGGARIAAIARIRRDMPGSVIVVHGVNDVGTSYRAVEEGLCLGLQDRLKRPFKPASYTNPAASDKDKVVDDPDAVYFKRRVEPDTESPVIPFYWGFREKKNRAGTINGQKVDRFGNRLDKDLSKGGGPFSNATTNLPDMWNKGTWAPVDPVRDPIRPLNNAPGRMYMVLAARRLAALISMIRDYDERETVSIVAHSQGCLITLLAQAFLVEKGLRTADTLVLTHPPYSLVDSPPGYIKLAEAGRAGEDGAMAGSYKLIDGRQTMHARLQTLVNLVNEVAASKEKSPGPDLAALEDAATNNGVVALPWKAALDRDNRGKVYLYFSPEDMTVALENVQGIGWQGVPDYVTGTAIRDQQEEIINLAGRKEAIGPVRPVPHVLVRPALKELGRSFFQRVFTAKERVDPLTGKVSPTLIGKAPPYDFPLRVRGEDEQAHVEGANRGFRGTHAPATWPIDPRDDHESQREGIRTITGEALRKPVLAVLDGDEHILPKDIPKSSAHAKLAAKDKGACEAVDPIDAATAVAREGGRRWRMEILPEGTSPSTTGKTRVFRAPELKALSDVYNQRANPGSQDSMDMATVIDAQQLEDGRILGTILESPNEARRRFQHEVSAKSFHGAIIGSSKNHRQVTAYDVAIGRGTAVSDPAFRAYLCAVADWRLIKPDAAIRVRPGIMTWNEFLNTNSVYFNAEPGWRRELIEGCCTYYSTGVLPSCLPLLTGQLWNIVISETKDGARIAPGGVRK